MKKKTEKRESKTTNSMENGEEERFLILNFSYLKNDLLHCVSKRNWKN